jgi:hypothetical protein
MWYGAIFQIYVYHTTAVIIRIRNIGKYNDD